MRDHRGADRWLCTSFRELPHHFGSISVFDENDGERIGAKSMRRVTNSREAYDRAFLQSFLLQVLGSTVEGGDAIQREGRKGRKVRRFYRGSAPQIQLICGFKKVDSACRTDASQIVSKGFLRIAYLVGCLIHQLFKAVEDLFHACRTDGMATGLESTRAVDGETAMHIGIITLIDIDRSSFLSKSHVLKMNEGCNAEAVVELHAVDVISVPPRFF